MSESIRITVLVENSVHRQGLAAEHGLSLHVQVGGRQLLFDTGQSGLAVANARALGIDLGAVEAIVLSHGHYDHTSGLPAILGAAPKARVYLHPAAFGSKFSKRPDGAARFIGMDQQTTQAIRTAAGGFIETRYPTKIIERVLATGEIPRFTAYEDTGGPFFLDAKGTQLDPLADDQAVVIDLGASSLLLLGCAHAGVVNTLDYALRITGGKPVHALIGGLHLGSASAERIQETNARLRAANLKCLAPLHCTGWPATAQLWQAFPAIFKSGGVGTIFDFQVD